VSRNIRCHRTKFCRPGNLVPGFPTPYTIPFEKNGHEAFFLWEEDCTVSLINTVHTNSTVLLNVPVSCRTVPSTMFLTASVLFTMASINYCVSYCLPDLLDTEDGVSVAPTSEVRDSPCSYNRL